MCCHFFHTCHNHDKHIDFNVHSLDNTYFTSVFAIAGARSQLAFSLAQTPQMGKQLVWLCLKVATPPPAYYLLIFDLPFITFCQSQASCSKLFTVFALRRYHCSHQPPGTKTIEYVSQNARLFL